MKLRPNEYCPIHRSLRCCGREQAQCVRGSEFSIAPRMMGIFNTSNPGLALRDN